jgi:hypothetical protein
MTSPLATSPKSTAVGEPVSRQAGSAGVTGWGWPTPSGRPNALTGEEPHVGEGGAPQRPPVQRIRWLP